MNFRRQRTLQAIDPIVSFVVAVTLAARARATGRSSSA